MFYMLYAVAVALAAIGFVSAVRFGIRAARSLTRAYRFGEGIIQTEYRRITQPRPAPAPAPVQPVHDADGVVH